MGLPALQDRPDGQVIALCGRRDPGEEPAHPLAGAAGVTSDGARIASVRVQCLKEAAVEREQTGCVVSLPVERRRE